ncbi:MAG: PqqD family protein [bacterium]
MSETLDGETIIIDLQNGTYYSMNETGSLVWEYLKAGHSLGQITQALAARYDASIETIEKSVTDLIASLQADNLISESPTAPALLVPETQAEKKSFIVPGITKYSDMQEMLLADPIHDVDIAGWPKLKENK